MPRRGVTVGRTHYIAGRGGKSRHVVRTQHSNVVHDLPYVVHDLPRAVRELGYLTHRLGYLTHRLGYLTHSFVRLVRELPYPAPVFHQRRSTPSAGFPCGV